MSIVYVLRNIQYARKEQREKKKSEKGGWSVDIPKAISKLVLF